MTTRGHVDVKTVLQRYDGSGLMLRGLGACGCCDPSTTTNPDEAFVFDSLEDAMSVKDHLPTTLSGFQPMGLGSAVLIAAGRNAP